MDTTIQDTMFFFDRHQAVYPLYERFQEKLLASFPESRIKVQKSQISYYNLRRQNGEHTAEKSGKSSLQNGIQSDSTGR